MLTTSKAKIYSRVTLHIRGLPTNIRWAFADSALLQAIRNGKEVVRGPRRLLLHKLLAILSIKHLQWFLIRLINLIEVTRIFINCKFSRTKLNTIILPRIFVGFGAGSEEELFQTFAADEKVNTTEILCLDQKDLGSFKVNNNLTLFNLFQQVQFSLEQVKSQWDTLPQEFCNYSLDFLTHVAMRLARYSFFHEWFKAYSKAIGQNPTVCMISPDTLAFAAVEAGVNSVFYQHGLLRLSGVFPDFMKIRALNEYEANYLRHMIPRAVVNSVLYPKVTMTHEANNTVLVASVYGSREQMNLVIPFLEWSESANLRLLVRLHPRETGDYWRSISGRYRFIIERSDETIFDAFARIRPAVVVSWFSTALVDALNYGLVPVRLSADEDDSVRDLIYPLTQLSLQWPEDMSKIAQTIHSAKFRSTLVTDFRLRAAMSVPLA